MKRPVVAVTTRRGTRKHRHIYYVGESHLELMLRLDLLPLMIPVVEGAISVLTQYRKDIRGLLLVEGEDIEPSRYDAEASNTEYLEKTHPLKDEIEVRLLRYALRENLPVLGICRGSQMMNVISGGTLYGDVAKEKQSSLIHNNPGPHYDDYRHPVTIVPDTPLAGWYQREAISVNSYHHQGVRQLADRFKPMAYADDGLIEAFYDPASEFTIGLQFHPERMLKEYEGNLRVWQTFAQAVHNRARK